MSAPRYPIRISRVLDGDTVQSTILMPWGLGLVDRFVRLLDYDAWEIHRRRGGQVISDAEIAKGLVAKQALTDLCAKATSASVERGPRDFDDFGRVLGRLFLTTPDGEINVAEWMTAHGHTRPPVQTAAIDVWQPYDCV